MAQNSIPENVSTNYLPQLIESYKMMNGEEQPSSWIVWSNGGEEVYTYFLNACHANMTETPKGQVGLITAVPHNDAISLAYQRMLINGPFRAMSDKITLTTWGEHYYIHCSELDKWPANLLYNYCIATRVPLEHKQLLPRWFNLTEEGFNPTLAFLLSYSEDGTPGSRSWPQPYHFWFDNSSNWYSILAGDVIKLSPSYAEHPKLCRPCDVIWGEMPHGLVDKFSLMSAKDISDHFQLPVQVSGPPKPFGKLIKPMKKPAMGNWAPPLEPNLLNNPAPHVGGQVVPGLVNALQAGLGNGAFHQQVLHNAAVEAAHAAVAAMDNPEVVHAVPHGQVAPVQWAFNDAEDAWHQVPNEPQPEVPEPNDIDDGWDAHIEDEFN